MEDELLQSYKKIIYHIKTSQPPEYVNESYVHKMKYDLKKIIKFEKYIENRNTIKILLDELDKIYKK